MKTTQQRYSAYFENALDAVIGMSAEGLITDWNPSAETVFGWARDEAMGRRLSELVIPEKYRKAHEEGLTRYLRTGHGPILRKRVEFSGLRRDGTKFPLELTVTPIEIDGKIQFYAFVRDLTEFKAATAQRDLFFEMSVDLLAIADTTGYFKRTNPSFEKVLGYTREELSSRPVLDFVYPEDREAVALQIEKLARGETVKGFECRYTTKDGSYRWLAWSARPFQSTVFAVARDVTETKRIQDALQVSESRFRRLVEEAPFSIQVLAPDGRTVMVNRAWRDLWGIPEEVVQNYILKDYNVLRDEQLAKRGIDHFIRRGFAGEATAIPAIQYETAEIEATKSHGHAPWVEGYIYPLKTRDGSIRELVLIHRDITDRVLREKTLKLLADTAQLLGASLDERETLQRIAAVAAKGIGDCCVVRMMGERNRLTSMAISCTDPEKARRLQEIGLSTANHPSPGFGPGFVLRTKSSQLVRNLASDLPPGDSAEARELLALGVKSYLTVPIKLKDDLLGTISLKAMARYYTEQDLVLAEELAVRAALAIQNSKLYTGAKKAIRLRDEFLAVASHELKTPLTAMNLQMQTLLSMFGKHPEGGHASDQLVRMFRNSTKQLESLAELIEGLLDISRLVGGGNLTLQPEPLDLVELARSTIVSLEERPENKSYEIRIHAKEPVKGHWDRFRIAQVITNLLTNALKYGEGKPIDVTVKRVADRAILSVKDRGIGIAAEDQERIFQRFERAVSPTHFRGLGLGLFITKEIVKLHGGKISVESKPGEGSVFTVELPLSAHRR